jgi:hypothetical protein
MAYSVPCERSMHSHLGGGPCSNRGLVSQGEILPVPKAAPRNHPCPPNSSTSPTHTDKSASSVLNPSSCGYPSQNPAISTISPDIVLPRSPPDYPTNFSSEADLATNFPRLPCFQLLSGLRCRPAPVYAARWTPGRRFGAPLPADQGCHPPGCDQFPG